MRTILLACALFISGTSLLSQNSADLKYNLEKNKAYRFKSLSEQNISQTVNGIQQNTSVKSNSTMSLKMIDATPEFIIAEVRFDTVIIQTNAMGMTTNINSTSEGNLQSSNTSDVMSCIMNRLSKNGLFAKMDYSGKVVELINTKMLSDIILKDTSMITGQTAATVKMQIKNMVSDKALKTMVETFTYYLPGRQVSKGDKWEINQTTSSGGMALDITTSYVLTDLQGNKASIAAEANIKASDNAGPLEYGGAKITYGEVKGISKAEMLVDATTGLLLQSTEKSHIAGSLSVSAPGVSMQIPMEIDSSSKVTAMP